MEHSSARGGHGFGDLVGRSWFGRGNDAEERRVPRWSFRAAGVVVGVQSVALALLGVAGLVVSWRAGLTAQVPTEVLGFRLNMAHGLLLLGTGLVGGAALIDRIWLRWFTVAQAVVYLAMFAFGTAFSLNVPGDTLWNLNVADNVLHAVLFVIGLTLTMVLFSKGFEPLEQRHPDIPEK